MSVPSIDPAAAAQHAAAGLHDAVGRGLHALRNLHTPGEEILSGKVESELRATASEWERQRTAGAPAGPLGELVATIHVACAHLGAHDLVEARLSLLALRDALPAPAIPPAEPGPARTRAGAASTAQKRALRQQATVEQAVGVVAAHGGTSPREALTLLRAHAAGHGVALLELANDIVAGRIDASALLVGRQRGRHR